MSRAQEYLDYLEGLSTRREHWRRYDHPWRGILKYKLHVDIDEVMAADKVKHKIVRGFKIREWREWEKEDLDSKQRQVPLTDLFK